MVFTAHAEAPPLREDAAGAVRVGDSRVLLELVIHAFQDGATPETIVARAIGRVCGHCLLSAAPHRDRRPLWLAAKKRPSKCGSGLRAGRRI